MEFSAVKKNAAARNVTEVGILEKGIMKIVMRIEKVPE